MMKSISKCRLFFTALLFLLFAASIVLAFPRSSYARAEGGAAYTVTDFSSAEGEEWQISESSNVSDSERSVNDDGELVISAVNAPNKLYYGALIPINGEAAYRNFTFELTFKVNKSFGDSNRGLGIAYRTKYASDAAPVTGYVMNYRLNGKNAYTAVNERKSFNDVDVIESGGLLADGTKAPKLSVGEYHKITITMEDELAKYYVDGHWVRDANVSDQTSHLGGVHTEGGFALIVSSMELCVRSCKIVPDQIIAPQPAKYDNTLVTTYQDSAIKIVNVPTVVLDVTDAETLLSLAGEEKPSNAILHFDKNGNVVGADGSILGTFSDVYAKLDHKIIPVVYVSDDDAATALSAYLNEKLRISDIAVMSDKPELVKKVRSTYSKIRGIVEFTHDDFYTDGKLDLFRNIVGKANANYAMTAVIPQSAATVDNVRYIQARFKTVWVRPADESETALRHCINSGAFGIVAKDSGAVYDVLESYPENSYTRMPYNVAHRGKFSNTSSGPYENSLLAVQAAIDGGATHLELDGHLTKDGHIVIMHDTNINRTTTGSGEISDMTLDEIRRYKLLDGQEIPVLEQVFELLCEAKEKGKDIVFVFELKAGATIAEKIDSLLGTGEGQYDIRDNLVIITFNRSDDLLASLKNVMPETPTSRLVDSMTAASLANDLADMGWYNCGYDAQYHRDQNTPEYDKSCLTDRGIPSWYWTYDNAYDVISATKRGHLGLTNNAPQALSSYICKIENAQTEMRYDVKTGDEVTLHAIGYDGASESVNAELCYVDCTDAGWNVIATYSSNGMKLYTQVFSIEYPNVKISLNGSVLTAKLDENGNFDFTAPDLDGKTYAGLFIDAGYTVPAAPDNITAGMTLYAKYDDLPQPPQPPQPTENINLGLAVGLPVGLVCAVALGIGLFFIIRKKRKG